MNNPLDPSKLNGISFYDLATGSQMRYIYPDTQHWTAGWIMRKTPGGQWVTHRKATDKDISAIAASVVQAHHKVTE